MKGKRLFHLITELSKREHRQLVHECSSSSDKRSNLLLLLLKKRNLSEESIDSWLRKIFCEKNTEENDKKQRRFVDFACKAVEDIFLRTYYTSSPKRLTVLSKIFDERNASELIDYYNTKSLEEAKKKEWNQIIIDELDIRVRWLSKNQNSENTARIAEILEMQKQFIDKDYLQQASYFFAIKSSLFIDNPAAFNNNSLIELSEIKEKTTDDFGKLFLAVAEMRFSFYDNKLFDKKMNHTVRWIEKASLPGPKRDVLLRSVFFTKATAGIYHNMPVAQMRLNVEKAFQLSIANNQYDFTTFFLLLFLLQIEDQFDIYDTYYARYNEAFLSVVPNEYLNFLNAYALFVRKENQKALFLLTQTSYAKSNYLAVWSRLIEIEIHLREGDVRFTKLLLDRAKKFLKKIKDQKILFEPVSILLNKKEMELKGHSSNVSTIDFYAAMLK